MPDDPMPFFVIKAKDRLALDAVRAYRNLCAAAGLDDQAFEVDEAINEIRAWQRRHPDEVRLPDHPHVPATEEPTP